MASQKAKPFQTKESQDALVDWWKSLADDKGGRAELRRAAGLMDVSFCSAYHRLRQGLQKQGDYSNKSLALIAGSLARVKTPVKNQSFAKTMATGREAGTKPRVSGLRFRRLLQTEDRDQLLTPIRRMLALTEGQADLVGLAKDLYYWGPRVRMDWAQDYYDQAKDAE